MDSLRDWGYAKDYVECMWLILQQDKPEDFVIATGVQHSVREFTKLAFKHAGIELKFEGEGISEKGIVVNGPENLIGKTVVAVSEDFYRPTDVVNLWGDPTKAKAKLGWNPNKTSFEELVKIMVEHDIAKVAAEGAAAKVRTNLAEYLEKGIVKYWHSISLQKYMWLATMALWVLPFGTTCCNEATPTLLAVATRNWT